MIGQCRTGERGIIISAAWLEDKKSDGIWIQEDHGGWWEAIELTVVEARWLVNTLSVWLQTQGLDEDAE